MEKGNTRGKQICLLKDVGWGCCRCLELGLQTPSLRQDFKCKELIWEVTVGKSAGS